MRIAYITTDFGIPVHGHKGASIHVREFSNALQGNGHEVEIFTCRMGGEAPDGFTVPVHEFPLEKPERRLISALQDDPQAGGRTPNEVRSMLYNANLRHRLLPLLQEFQPDAIYERYALLGTAGQELAKALGIPHILEVNAPLSEEQARHRGIVFDQTIRAIEQRIIAGADQVISVSEPLKQWIVGTGASAGRVTVLPNGVNTDRFAERTGTVRERLGLGDRPVVGFVGTLKAWHGTDTLIRAMGSLVRERGPDRTPALLIVGDGPQRDQLESLARDEGLGDVTIFTGMVPHGEIPNYLAAIDIAVAPYAETGDVYFSPLKLFEYMAMGCTVIAADTGQIREYIRHMDNGILYTPGDTDALAGQVAAMLDDPIRARILGKTARHEARSTMSWSRIADAVTGLVEREQASLDKGMIHGS